MKKIYSFLLVIVVIVLLFIIFKLNNNEPFLSPISENVQIIIKPLEKYSFESLKNTKFNGSEIIIDKVLKKSADYTSYLFYFKVQNKKVSGLINVPNAKGVYPVIVMNRGYVDKKQYETGIGTQHAGEVFAQNGFVTLAPDFLGYGMSDKQPNNPMEERFLTYVTNLELIASIKNLNNTLVKIDKEVKIDETKVGLWGHSNGGQITLSVLEISGLNYPTVLWAPVSKPFPYSILYYTDDSDDHGKALRKVVATFEKDYDIEKYSLTNYFNWIKGSIEIHQGIGDDAVPYKWSEDLEINLEKQNIDVTFFEYIGDDHNFSKGNWSTVVLRNIDFYKKKFIQ
ncbi:MAG: prolyl oligopeptidase family serine peptidase [bacterium]|nr:prolyl oligopeptidase family serine peptidase [bacterium]